MPLCLAAVALGVALGLALPVVAAEVAGAAVTPVLALLLFATFLAVPMSSLARAFRDGRFLGTVLGVNFLLVPLLAFGLSRFVADRPEAVFGVLLVLLTPCVDYVVVFAGLAGGAREKLLAATPLLLVVQLLLLPVYLALFIGPSAVGAVEPGPFLEAFLVLIVLPLAAAWGVQALAARWRRGRAVPAAADRAMVPLLMLTLGLVAWSQMPRIAGRAAELLPVVPIFAAFLVAAVAIGWLTVRAVRLARAEARAAVFSGATRNSLVVLPLALALPEGFELVPAVVVTQTLVELLGMLLLVRVVPAILR